MHLPPEPPPMRNVIAYPPGYPLFSKAGIAEYQLVDPDPSLSRARERDARTRKSPDWRKSIASSTIAMILLANAAKSLLTSIINRASACELETLAEVPCLRAPSTFCRAFGRRACR